MERRLAAIFAADVAGYSRLIGVDEEGTIERFQAHRRELFDPKVAEHQGRIVKMTGDGFLVEFASPVRAVRCAIEVQQGMADRNADIPQDRRIEFRIGINLGDIVVEDGDVYGDCVNVAARLESIAEPGTVYISRAVREFIQGRAEIVPEDLGEKVLKNIAAPVRVFRIAPLGLTTGPVAAGPPTVPDKPSIAVLPFMNMSSDIEQDYFSDGMTEDLITDLSKVSGLFVIARNSSFAYKGRSVKVQDIARDLGVRFVLEGSIRKAGNRVRITAQLIDATNGGHLWAERFDRDITDIFSTQDEVVEKIVGVLAVTLTKREEERLHRRGTSNLQAYETWLRAREWLARGSRESLVEAKALHGSAIKLDPDFAAPHAGLALAAVSEYASGWSEDPVQTLQEAERWARRAIELDAQDPVSHMALGNVMLWRRDHEGALAECRNMIAMDPNFASGYGSTGVVLMYAGRPAEALESFVRSMRLDPLYPAIVLHFVAQAHFALGDYDAATKLLIERIRRNPGTDSSRMLLASCHGHLGRFEEARAAWAEMLNVSPEFSLAQRERVMPYKDAREFQRIVEGLKKAGLP